MFAYAYVDKLAPVTNFLETVLFQRLVEFNHLVCGLTQRRYVCEMNLSYASCMRVMSCNSRSVKNKRRSSAHVMLQMQKKFALFSHHLRSRVRCAG